MLLMFFTSVLMPRGSPGLWTDTLASTLSWPSEEKEVKEMHTERGKKFGFRGIAGAQKQRERGRQRDRDREWFPYQTCCLDRCPGLAGWAEALWQLQQPPLRSSCLAPSPAPLDLHLMDVKTAVFYISQVSIPWSFATNLFCFVRPFKIWNI